jgi:hypothetical protein
MRCRHGVDDDGSATERLRLEANAAELLLVGLEGIQLFVGKLQGEREEQTLGGSPHAAQLHQDGFIEHTLVGRVLIDDDDAVGSLVHDVAVEHLHHRNSKALLDLGKRPRGGARIH